MDPNACIERFLRAIEEDDIDEADEALYDLRTWLEKGGFMPSEELVRKLLLKLLTTIHIEREIYNEA